MRRSCVSNVNFLVYIVNKTMLPPGSPWCGMFVKASRFPCIAVRRTYKNCGPPILSPINSPNTCHLTTMPDQLMVNQEVPDDDVCGASADTSSTEMMCPSKLESSTTCPNRGLASPHLTMMSSLNHPAQPTFSGPRTSDGSSSSTHYSYHNVTQGQYSTHFFSESKPQAMVIPQPQSIYALSSPTTTNMLASVSNYAWNNAPTLHSTQHYDHVSGGTAFISPEMRSSSSYAFPMLYPDVHHSPSTFSSQHTGANQDIPFAFDREMPTVLYNEFPHQWQNSAIPQPAPLSRPLPSMILPPFSAESSQMIFALQPCASHGGNIYYPSDRPATNQPYSIPLHSHPSSPLLLSCRWLRGDTPCGFTGTLKVLKAHCRTSHFSGSQNTQIECRWEACDYHKRDDPTVHAMRRDCIWRHTSEVHLGMKRGT
ncbi:hypothetical protein DFH29DRAFT_919680 [Suillus ampliporus]|nr:hypothetical protein DFH29DRAFT_919680 [Suillus ampliporus]